MRSSLHSNRSRLGILLDASGDIKFAGLATMPTNRAPALDFCIGAYYINAMRDTNPPAVSAAKSFCAKAEPLNEPIVKGEHGAIECAGSSFAAPRVAHVLANLAYTACAELGHSSFTDFFTVEGESERALIHALSGYLNSDHGLQASVRLALPLSSCGEELPPSPQDKYFVNTDRISLGENVALYFGHGVGMSAAYQLRDVLVENIRDWSKSSNCLSQNHFWQFFDIVRDYSNPISYFGNLIYSTTGHHKDKKAQTCADAASSCPTVSRGADLFRFDSRRWFLFDRESRDLSARDVQKTIRLLRSQIDRINDDHSIDDFFKLFIDTLTFEVMRRVRFSFRYQVSRSRGDASALLTRDQVMCFFIHTGNPPPRCRDFCAGTNQGPVALITVTREANNEAVCRRDYRGNLPGTFRRGRTGAYFYGSAQDCGTTAGGSQLAGRRCIGRHSSVVQFAGTPWGASQRQVAYYFCLGGGRRRGFRYPAGTSLGIAG